MFPGNGLFPRWERDIPTLGTKRSLTLGIRIEPGIANKQHLSINKEALLRNKGPLLQHKEALLQQ